MVKLGNKFPNLVGGKFKEVCWGKIKHLYKVLVNNLC